MKVAGSFIIGESGLLGSIEGTEPFASLLPWIKVMVDLLWRLRIRSGISDVGGEPVSILDKRERMGCWVTRGEEGKKPLQLCFDN